MAPTGEVSRYCYLTDLIFLENRLLMSMMVSCSIPSPVHRPTNSDYTLIWNSGTSMCVTSDKTDFPDGIIPLHRTTVHSFAIGLRTVGIGMVYARPSKVVLHHLKLPSYYITKATQYLISTHTIFCNTYPGNSIYISDGF